MHYDVIVTVEKRQQHANHTMIGAPSEIKNLFRELFSSSTKITSEGILRSRKNGRIELSYKDDERRDITVSFMKNEPSLIAFTRGETLFENATTLYLEEGIRHRSVSTDLCGDRIEITVMANKIDNRLLKSGKLKLDYSIYVCGACAEINEIDIVVTHDNDNKKI